MTRDAAIEAAGRIARAKAWPWDGPFVATKSRRWWLFGATRWQVRSHADQRGRNVTVVLDDATGEVVSSTFLPR